MFNVKSNKAVCSFAASVAIATMMLSNVSANTGELPSSIVMNGKAYVMDAATCVRGTAEPDKRMTNAVPSNYSVIDSSVALYIDSSHGQGGDHYASGYVRATAPSFKARAEVYSNGSSDTTGSNYWNSGDRADATSYLACGIRPNASAHIFYEW